MEKEKMIGQTTDEQIKAWKERYTKGVSAIVVKDRDGKKHVCYIRMPERKDISAATTASRVDTTKFTETLLRQCWLGGDETIRTDDYLYYGASGQIAEAVEVADAELVKL